MKKKKKKQMDKNKFDALLPLIVAALMQKIIEYKKISQDEAFSRLYNSTLYFFLENERTKVWHYSAEKLFRLFDEELNTGKLELPEY
jgi:tRNA(His) 5'-end guanylyltransferase